MFCEAKMKKLVLSLALLLPCSVMMAAKPKPNPADYTVTVHVVFSRSGEWHSAERQVLEAVVDGQPMEMSGDGTAVLLPGDYKARLIGMKAWDKRISNDYEVAPTYEFLFDDGTTRLYVVDGMGLKGGAFVPASGGS
jgi:hypothetical protein